ncbi:MAG: hypothetical protein ACRDRJ_16690 [Streptosporangiaceae bacterium]
MIKDNKVKQRVTRREVNPGQPEIKGGYFIDVPALKYGNELLRPEP